MPMRTVDNLPLLTFESFDAHAGVGFAVTTRHGGESASPFDALNLGLGVADDPDTVGRNRARVAAATGAQPGRLTFAGQVHGARVAVVGEDDAGRRFAETDGLVTNRPDTPLVILVADCVAVGLYDPVRQAVGIAHAGWRGTLGAIVAETVRAMEREFGSTPGDLIAGIGPSIGPCCYEVGPEVVEAFYERHPEIAPDILSTPDFASAGSFEGAVNDDRMVLDLWRTNALLLEGAGVPPSHIETAATCTSCNTRDFFSHRAEGGRTGRFGGVIQLYGRSPRPW